MKTKVLNKNINSKNNYHPLDIFKFQNNKNIISSKKAVLPCKINYVSNWETPEFKVKITTNNLGLRSINSTDLNKTKIAFFGDSFTFGHGVEESERYSNIINENIDSLYKVDNFSYINGFQPEHYEFYIRNNPELRPILTIIGLYLGNDLCSDIKETNYDRELNKLNILSRAVTKEGVIINNINYYKFPINYLINSSYFMKLLVTTINRSKNRQILFKNHIPNSPNNIKIEMGQEMLFDNRAIKSLLEIKKILENRKSKLLVLLIPQNYFFNNFNNPHIDPKLVNNIDKIVNSKTNILSNICQTLEKFEIDYYNPLDTLCSEMYFKKDAHWNSSGHKAVGLKLLSKIKNIINENN